MNSFLHDLIFKYIWPLLKIDVIFSWLMINDWFPLSIRFAYDNVSTTSYSTIKIWFKLFCLLPCQKVPIDYMILLFLASKTNITMHHIETRKRKTNNTMNITKVWVYICLLIRLEKNLCPWPVMSKFLQIQVILFGYRSLDESFR